MKTIIVWVLLVVVLHAQIDQDISAVDDEKDQSVVLFIPSSPYAIVFITQNR